jgi:hypothetical protein
MVFYYFWVKVTGFYYELGPCKSVETPDKNDPRFKKEKAKIDKYGAAWCRRKLPYRVGRTNITLPAYAVCIIKNFANKNRLFFNFSINKANDITFAMVVKSAAGKSHFSIKQQFEHDMYQTYTPDTWQNADGSVFAYMFIGTIAALNRVNYVKARREWSKVLKNFVGLKR